MKEKKSLLRYDKLMLKLKKKRNKKYKKLICKNMLVDFNNLLYQHENYHTFSLTPVKFAVH